MTTSALVHLWIISLIPIAIFQFKGKYLSTWNFENHCASSQEDKLVFEVGYGKSLQEFVASIYWDSK